MNKWDSEIWHFPVLLMFQPNLAQTLLKYRFDRLFAATQRAKEAGYKGAMYPWESALSGYEIVCLTV